MCENVLSNFILSIAQLVKKKFRNKIVNTRLVQINLSRLKGFQKGFKLVGNFVPCRLQLWRTRLLESGAPGINASIFHVTVFQRR